MTRFSAVQLTALLASSVVVAADDPCPIPGSPIQWVADYCLFTSATDDLIAAQPCIDREHSRAFPDACTAKRHYKRLLCAAHMDAGIRTDAVDACVADREFSGRVVREDGI